MNKKHRYHKYHNDWILEHKDEFFTWAEMCKEYNKIFGTDLERIRFKNHCTHDLGLRVSNYFYTEEQKEWLKEKYPVLGAKKTTEEFNQKFKRKSSIHTIKEMCHSLGLTLNEDTFAKYREDTTKAMVDYAKNVRASKVGTVGRPSNGYDLIKTEDGWKSLGKYLYEKNIGKVPKGHQVIFLDGNKENRDVSNLAVVPLSYQALMNTYNLRSSDAEITKTSVMWCELYETLKKENVTTEIDI